ncbi:helix-turn-helix domain-containing protein [Priestia megaterium]|uniref:helix-turn-helix domain-containing protein n=1 Tax=Priestia megaterium TaxID=1404 RepID=UPI00300BEF2A
MSFKIELPEDIILTNKNDLKSLIKEMILELQGEKSKAEIITIKEAAKYLKVSIPTVRNMITNEEIPFFQKGQIIRLNLKDIEEWVRRNSKCK